MEAQVDKLYSEAVQKLKEANEELCRPEEDVVAYLVCQNSQIAIGKFLKGFLLQNRRTIENEQTIDDLYASCLAINDNFKEIDLAGFDCQASNLESRYCSGPGKVSRCFEIADSVDAFFRKENFIS